MQPHACQAGKHGPGEHRLPGTPPPVPSTSREHGWAPCPSAVGPPAPPQPLIPVGPVPGRCWSHPADPTPHPARGLALLVSDWCERGGDTHTSRGSTRVGWVLGHMNGSFVQGVSARVTAGAGVGGPAAASTGAVHEAGVRRRRAGRGEPCAGVSGSRRDVHQQMPLPRVARHVHCPAHTRARPCPGAPSPGVTPSFPAEPTHSAITTTTSPSRWPGPRRGHGGARGMCRACTGLGSGQAVLAAVPVLRAFHTAGAAAVPVLVLGAVLVLSGVLVLVLGAVPVFNVVPVLLQCWCSPWCSSAGNRCGPGAVLVLTAVLVLGAVPVPVANMMWCWCRCRAGAGGQDGVVLVPLQCWCSVLCRCWARGWQ